LFRLFEPNTPKEGVPEDRLTVGLRKGDHDGPLFKNVVQTLKKKVKVVTGVIHTILSKLHDDEVNGISSIWTKGKGNMAMTTKLGAATELFARFEGASAQKHIEHFEKFEKHQDDADSSNGISYVIICYVLNYNKLLLNVNILYLMPAIECELAKSDAKSIENQRVMQKAKEEFQDDQKKKRQANKELTDKEISERGMFLFASDSKNNLGDCISTPNGNNLGDLISTPKANLMELLKKSSAVNQKPHNKPREQAPTCGPKLKKDANSFIQTKKRGAGQHAGEMGMDDRYIIYLFRADWYIKAGFSSSNPWNQILLISRNVPQIEIMAVFFVEGIVVVVVVVVDVVVDVDVDVDVDVI
jgi:hypothetical protein